MLKTIATIATHYQTIGQGPSVVLLHGWGCDWQIWSPLITELSNHYRLVIPDLPVFGNSAQPDTVWSSQDYAKWLNQFLQETVGDEPFVLVGHSFGGKLAMTWATSYSSEQAKLLVLVDSAGLPDPLPWPRQLQMRLLGLIPASLKNRVPKTWRGKALNAIKTSTDHFYSNPQQKAILEHTVRESVASIAPSLKVPTLIMWGANDLDTPVHQAKSMATLIPGAKLQVFENSGHFPFIDETPRFLATLKPYLQEALS